MSAFDIDLDKESNLPATIFSKKHLDIKQVLIEKLIEALKGETKMTHYGITENYYKKACEQIKLDVTGYHIVIEITEKS